MVRVHSGTPKKRGADLLLSFSFVNYCAYELLGAPACGKISKKIVIELVKIPNLQAFLEACMKVNVRLLTSTVIVSALLMMILAACAPDASQFILSPNLSKQIAARCWCRSDCDQRRSKDTGRPVGSREIRRLAEDDG